MNVIKHFEKNTAGEDWVVGDIHGCFTLLARELNNIAFNPEVDRLFCVGDMVDRGPESHKFLEWLGRSWFHSVVGNHEQLLVGNYEGNSGQYHCHTQNGGMWFENTLLVDSVTRKEMYEACKSLPFVIEVDTPDGLVGIIHADPGSYTNWEAFKLSIEDDERGVRANCTWGRTRISYEIDVPISGLHKLYVGHTPLKEVRTLGNVVYIDTGACFSDGKFTLKRIN